MHKQRELIDYFELYEGAVEEEYLTSFQNYFQEMKLTLAYQWKKMTFESTQ